MVKTQGQKTQFFICYQIKDKKDGLRHKEAVL